MKNFADPIITVCAVMMSILSYGQELPKVIPPSPTVANLMQFEEVPVSHYTGQPNITIPLYAKQLSNTLNLNMALSYNTQGIKLRSYSGWVGTGWNLEVGGVVSRTVRGLPDEKRKGDNLPGGSNGTGVLNNPDYWNYDDNPSGFILTGSREEFVWNANGNSQDRYDYESDLFQFSALGISGRFVITNGPGELPTAKLLTKDLEVEIEIDYSTTNNEISSLNSFTIVDNQGNRLIFDQKESLQSEAVSGRKLVNGETFISSSGPRFSVSSWYLSKVETSNGKELVSFIYEDDDVNYSSPKAVSSNVINNAPSNWTTISQNSYNASVLPPVSSFSINTISGDTKKLKEIYFSRDSSRITFISGGSHPETDGNILNEIIIADEHLDQSQNIVSVENKRFAFDYEEFDEFNKNRLWLIGIDEIAGIKTYPYILEYVNHENLKKYEVSGGSNFYFESAVPREDNWGYLDGSFDTQFNNSCTASNDYFDHDLIKTGLLEKIIYPNGGVREFDFEHNTISYSSADGLLNLNAPTGQAVSQPYDYYRQYNSDNWLAGGGSSFTFDSTIHNNENPNDNIFQTLEINYTATINYARVAAIVNRGSCQDPETDEEILWNAKIEIKGTGSNSNYVHNIRLDDLDQIFELQAGTYEIRLYHLNNCVEIDVDVCFGFQNYSAIPVSSFVYGGGVRIKEIRFYDENDDTLLPLELRDPADRKISYSYIDENDPKKSSGTIDGSMMGQIISYTQNYDRYLVPDDCPSMAVAQSLSFTTESRNAAIDMTQGQYVGYKTVTVSQENNGKTMYTFTSAQEDGFASPPNTFNYPFNTPTPNLDYKRGLLQNQKIFDENNTEPSKETINTYTFHSNDIAPSFRLYTDEGCIWKTFFSGQYTDYVNASPSNRLEQCIGNNGCAEDCIVNYSNCGNVPYNFLSDPVESVWANLTETKTIDYFYDALSTQSSMETRQTFEYLSGTTRIKEQITFILEDGQEREYKTKYYYPFGGLPSNYDDSNGMLLALWEINKKREVVATETFKDGIKLSQTNTYYNDFDDDSDDAPNEDLKLILPETVVVGKGNDVPESRIKFHEYDQYGNPLEVSKADGARIMYVWGYGDTRPIVKIVGHSYTNISSGLLSAINAAKIGAYDDVDETTENALIADLNAIRSHSDLTNAQVTTFTYDPLIGVTSVTDPRGYLMTYRYDDFNRLEYVKDKDGNILSKNEYNYKNQY